MNRRIGLSLGALSLMMFLVSSCDNKMTAKEGTDASTDPDDGTTTCSLMINTADTATANANGCKLLTRDTSSCNASRTGAGLSGFWLKFSCRVSLTKAAGKVTVSSDGFPDHLSNYFSSSDPCNESFSAAGRSKNPNFISEQTIVMKVSDTPMGVGISMPGGVVGVAVNGAAIYSNAAAPGDSIYDEVATFDRCEGHPDMKGFYHYHTEPPAITSTDSELIGVMRDGVPVYGIMDMGGVTPVGLDAEGGHTGVTPDSGGASVYHYHAHLQTEAAPGARTAYFITSGKFKNAFAPGDCTGCN